MNVDELLDLLEATVYRLCDAGVSREDIETAVDEAISDCDIAGDA